MKSPILMTLVVLVGCFFKQSYANEPARVAVVPEGFADQESRRMDDDVINVMTTAPDTAYEYKGFTYNSVEALREVLSPDVVYTIHIKCLIKDAEIRDIYERLTANQVQVVAMSRAYSCGPPCWVPSCVYRPFENDAKPMEALTEECIPYIMLSDDAPRMAALLDNEAAMPNKEIFAYEMLRQACQSGSWRIFKYLIEQDFAAHLSNQALDSLLLLACEGAFLYGNSEFNRQSRQNAPLIIEFLLNQGAHANAADSEGKTALMRASHPEIAALLLKHGADVNARDEDDYTALMHILSRTLLANTQKEQNECVYELVQLLLNQGADIHCRTWNGRTPLMVFITGPASEYTNSEDVIRLLVQRGLDINAQDDGGMTALMNAADFDEESIVTLLCELGADLNLQDEVGKTALFYAFNLHNYFFCESTNVLNLPTGDSHIMTASPEDFILADVLLAKGANINAQDKDGCTILHREVQENTPLAVQFLLTRGADSSIKDNNGKTAFDYAQSKEVKRIFAKPDALLAYEDESSEHITSGHSGVTELMEAACGGDEHLEDVACYLKEGADISAQDIRGRTALFYAFREHNIECHFGEAEEDGSDLKLAKYLIECGANINVQDDKGWTILHIEVQENSLPAVRLLLEHGATPSLKDKSGKTPLDYARTEAMKELLRSNIKN